jgi:uncharacterized protein YndB with AHSA1/START domain
MNKLYSVEREYPVAVTALWDAWMDADALQSWYSPTDLKVLPGSVVSEPVLGGWWTVAVDVSQFGELPADQAEGAKAGMESYFDNLGAFLAR